MINFDDYRKVEQVIEHNIKPSMAAIKQMKVTGVSDRNIAIYLGISLKHFNEAKEMYEPLKTAYEDASEELLAGLQNVVYGRALGTDGRLDKNGKPIPADEKLAWEIIQKVDARYKNKVETTSTITIESLVKEIRAEQVAVDIPPDDDIDF